MTNSTPFSMVPGSIEAGGALPGGPAREETENDKLRADVADTLTAAHEIPITVAYAPRFLHSTGQLHKGGADNAMVLQITAEDKDDLDVPGEDWSFGVLKEAQAVGDFQALASKGRRVPRIHARPPIDDCRDAIRQNIAPRST